MNFLAHFHLAWPEDELVAGALEGDYHKGPLCGRLPAGIERGIALHRAIDAYTDSHPQMADLRRRFSPELRRYAGILIDLSFDHYLSRHWRQFSDVPLDEFIPGVYRSLESHSHSLSGNAGRMLGRMQQYDLLGRYHDWESIPASAERIGQRFRRGNPFTDTREQLEPVRVTLEEAFLDFYPELLAYTAEAKQRLN